MVRIVIHYDSDIKYDFAMRHIETIQTLMRHNASQCVTMRHIETIQTLILMTKLPRDLAIFNESLRILIH